jgi:hypothetical protein
MSYPRHMTAGVDLAGEVEAGAAGHHAEDAAGQGGVLGVVVGGDAVVGRIDVEVDSAPASAAADLHVRQVARSLFDLLKLLIVDTDAPGVTGDGVEVKAAPAGSLRGPAPRPTSPEQRRCLASWEVGLSSKE